MSETINKRMINQMPIAYAYHHVLLNDKGVPIDYEFLEVNTAFEKFTGLKAKNIIGRKATEVIDDIENDDFDWISEYGKIALEGGLYEIEQYSGAFDKWYQIQVVSDERFYFATYFTDITEFHSQVNDYKVLLNSLNDAVFEVNDQLVFEKVFAPDESILLFPKELIIGKRISDLFDGTLLEDFLEVFQKAKKTNEMQSYEYSLLIDNQKKWYQMNVRALKINQLEKFVISLIDITDKIQALEELTQKTNELERFFSINLDLLCIANTKGEFLKVNKAWEETLGYTADELEGRSYFDFVHPDDLEETIKATNLLEDQNIIDNFVNRFRIFNGSYKYIEWKSRAYEDVIYAAARDITEKSEMEEQLFLEKEKYQSTLFSIGDGVIAVNNLQKITLMNKVAEELTGWKQDDAIHRPFKEVVQLIHEKNRTPVDDPVEKVLKTGATAKMENHTVLIRKDRTEIAIEDSAAPIHDSNRNIRGAVLVFHDVTQKRKSQSEILYLSYHDFLTGLYNRRYFEEEAERLDHAGNLPLSVLMLDVNGLKLTNDAFGHRTGDALLKKVAEIIKKNARMGDLIARLGGDEFAVLLPKTNKKEAMMIGQRILKYTELNTVGSVIISVAIGQATRVAMNQSFEETVKIAENMMYKNKVQSSRLMRDQTIILIQETLNKKSDMERIHSQRVGRIAKYLGEAMNLTIEQVKMLETIGLLHDLGKIIVPEEILKKEGKLSEKEYSIMKNHAETGYQILKSVEEYVPIAEIVLSHHEWWDGTGYPRNLSGLDIPFFSRIIQVADAYEAMTADRPYQKAFNKDEAIKELKALSGIQFDPKIVDILVEKVLIKSFDE
ncbi:PAS domain S-box protein [Eubacteriaceae bacterium ES2]|nr:PAS domain S-box protein [Eubacteriaceae bacterium ES2]